MLFRFLLTVVFIGSTASALGQTVYAASQSKLGLAFGGGGSDFDPDFAQGPSPSYLEQTGMGQGRRWGFTGWADAGMPFGPPWLRGFGVEAEYRSVYAGDMVDQTGLKESTAGGGATYTWRHWRSLRPYVKYIFSLGSISFTPIPFPGGGVYSRDSRTARALGGGIEIRCTDHISARADYEYQSWGLIFGTPGLSPQGVSVGAMYNLRKSPIR